MNENTAIVVGIALVVVGAIVISMQTKTVQPKPVSQTNDLGSVRSWYELFAG